MRAVHARSVVGRYVQRHAASAHDEGRCFGRVISDVQARSSNASVVWRASALACECVQESGWKLVHGDVLRPPAYPLLLSVSIGTGTQLLGMAVISIVCAMLGFLSPANRGGNAADFAHAP